MKSTKLIPLDEIFELGVECPEGGVLGRDIDLQYGELEPRAGRFKGDVYKDSNLSMSAWEYAAPTTFDCS